MSIIAQIVSHCRASDSNLFAIKCVAEHMRGGRRTFFSLPKQTRRVMMRAAIKTHTENRQRCAEGAGGQS